MPIDTQQVKHIIAGGESFTVEFKSDVKRFSDHDICKVVVCFGER